MSNVPLLTFDGVSRHFGGLKVLQDVHLAVPALMHLSVRLLKEEVDSVTGTRNTLVKPVLLQTKGVASSDVLIQIMGVNPIPPVEEACWFSDYTAKIENGPYEDADGLSLRQKLETHFGSQHPLMLDAERLIRFQAFKLRKKSTAQD